MSELTVQAIGFVGVAFFIISYQIKSNKALFLCQMIGCIIFCVQFFIMGAYTGAVSLIINIIRNLLLVKRKDWKWVDRRSTMLVILALLTLMTIYTWDGIISLLPFISVQSWKMNVHAESSFLSFTGLPVRDRIAQTNPDFPLGISHFPG